MHIKNDILFPRLSSEQIQSLTGIGEVEDLERGTILIEAGQNIFDCFVVIKGSIAITNPYDNYSELVVHEEGEFTGDSDMLSHRAAMVQAVVKEPGTILRIKAENLRKIISNKPEISDIFIRAFLARRDYLINETNYGYKIIGSRFSPSTYTIREFLTRNTIPYTWIEIEKDEAAAMILENFGIKPEDTPVIIARDNTVHKNPSLEAIARCAGVSIEFKQTEYELVVVGAGPAGLAACVYAASEGIKTLAIDSTAPGGQAGASSKIENYLGFPSGISGQDLATAAYTQAQKFGCDISIPSRAIALECGGNGLYKIILSNEEEILARSIIIATGAKYRKLELENLSEFEGRGIYYGATIMDSQTCADEEIVVVGAGNSAGQGAMFLSKNAKKVHLLVRGGSLEATMSKYLISRIESTSNIELHLETEITKLEGESHLVSIDCKSKNGKEFQIKTSHIFTLIGASPCTEWTKPCIKLDAKGFIVTGNDLSDQDLEASGWSIKRKPMLLETSRPGIFAVGDVRSGSTKRVASSVGEGSICVSQVHQIINKFS